jgi:hypothetical protein
LWSQEVGQVGRKNQVSFTKKTSQNTQGRQGKDLWAP